MKATKDKVENHQAYLTIQAEPADMEKSMEEAYHHLNQSTRIPGFRKGKTPRVILERYLGKEALLEHALEHLLPDMYEQALKEQELEAVAQPELEVTQRDPAIFKAIVPLKPTIKLGDYHTIKVKQEPVEVTESNINDVIEQLRHQHATWEPVERPIAFGDLITMDIESTIEEKPFYNQKGASYQVLKGQSLPAPGFADKLVGMRKGEEKQFKLPLPADYSQKELAGKEVDSKVKINEIKEEKLPEVNADLAKAVSADLLTVDALREQATKELKTRGEERSKQEFEEQAIDAVAKISEIEYPPVMVESETTRILSQRFQNNRQALDNYLRLMNKTEGELREELKPSAAKGVVRSLVLGQIASDEKLEVTDAEIDVEIETMTKDATEKKEDLKKFFKSQEVRTSIAQTLLTRKTIKVLTDAAEANKETQEPEETKEKKKTKKKKEEEK